MRLINPGTGEITDRLTILALKILIGTEKGKKTDAFRTEQIALLQTIRSRTLNGAWFEQVLELAAVNGQLWEAEDRLRGWRTAGCTEVTVGAVATLAFRIQALNDRRSELISAINLHAGEASHEEKI